MRNQEKTASPRKLGGFCKVGKIPVRPRKDAKFLKPSPDDNAARRMRNHLGRVAGIEASARSPPRGVTVPVDF